MASKQLKDMNLIDDFLFEKVVTYPEIGEKVCSRILEIILGRKIGKISVVAQKVYAGRDGETHGARLDVYVDETRDEAEAVPNEIFDIEPDKNEDKKASLPRRVRSYRAKMDERMLKSGDEYSKLKRVYIIMILSYDPFGLGRMVYTVKNRCIEEPDMPYDDGAENIFLYCDGTVGSPPGELADLLHLFRGRKADEMENKNLEDIDRMVDQVKNDEVVGVTFLNMFDHEKEAREENLAEGRKVGQALGESYYAALADALISAGRIDDLKKISTDTALREKLYKEYGIKKDI